jgi:hypothetical protein
MATFRLLNPDAGQVEEAIAEAVRQANSRARTGTVFAPDSLARLIVGTAEGVHQSDGGGGWTFYTPYSVMGESSRTFNLFAAWWTAPGGEKFVLIDGRRVETIPATPESSLGVPEIKAKPEDAIRGWRRPRSIRIRPTFRGAFADLGRRPDTDPTREALRLAALYGDTSAGAALHDFDEERGSGAAR